MFPKIKAYVIENKTDLGRKALAAIGAAAGFLLIDVLIDRPRTTVEEVVVVVADATEEPIQPEGTDEEASE